MSDYYSELLRDEIIPRPKFPWSITVNKKKKRPIEAQRRWGEDVPPIDGITNVPSRMIDKREPHNKDEHKDEFPIYLSDEEVLDTVSMFSRLKDHFLRG